MLITSSTQYNRDTVTSAIPEQIGRFKQKDARATDAGLQVQSTGQVPEKVPLSSRVIHPFKSILLNIRNSFAYSGQISLLPGFLVCIGVGLVTILPSVATFGCLGALIQMAKKLVGYDSQAFQEALFIGLYAAIAIAIPTVIITYLAITLALFCVITPVSTLLQIPKFIRQAATTTSREDLNNLHVEADKTWSNYKEGMLAIATGIRNYLT